MRLSDSAKQKLESVLARPCGASEIIGGRIMTEQADRIVAVDRGAKRVSRRVVVRGAAWSIPVIAAAVATSAEAASSSLVLSFNTPAAATTCGPYPTTVLTAARNGAPAAGVAVTVSLPSGLTWADGSTAPKTFVTNAQGQVDLTNQIKVPKTAASYTLTGSAAGATTATTTDTFQLGTVLSTHANSGTVVTAVSPTIINGKEILVPTQTQNDANYVPYAAVLTSDGKVVDGTTGKVLATGVVDAAVGVVNGVPTVYYITTAGQVYSLAQGSSTPTLLSTIPGATQIKATTGPNGNVSLAIMTSTNSVYTGSGTLVANNVSSFGVVAGSGTSGRIYYTTSTGQAIQYIIANGSQTTYGTVSGTPVDTEAIGGGGGVVSTYTLTSTGNLYFWQGTVNGAPTNSMVLIATNVTDFEPWIDYGTPNQPEVSYLTTTGGGTWSYNGGSPVTHTNPAWPAGTTIASVRPGIAIVRESNGDVRWLNNPSNLVQANSIDAVGTTNGALVLAPC